MLKKTYLLAAAAALTCPLFQNSAEAGDIDAQIQNGHLFIYGTDDDSSITITSPSEYSVQITGMQTMSGEPTTVNGNENGTVVLEGWTRGIFIYNYGGDDHVDIQNLTSAGPVTIDQGSGDDQLMIGTDEDSENLLALAPFEGASALMAPTSVHFNSYLVVYAGTGHDDVVMRGTHVERTTTVDLGLGDDYFAAGGASIESTRFGNNTFILPGNGADEVVIEQVGFESNFVMDDISGPLTMTVNDTTVANSAYVYATPEADEITAMRWDIGDYLLVITEAGNDRVSYSGTNSNAAFYTGEGMDLTELYDVTSGNVLVQTAGGNDRTWLSSSTLSRFDLYGSAGDDYFKIRSTSAPEGYVFGASGFDTVATSTLFPNNVDNYKLYSIETEEETVR